MDNMSVSFRSKGITLTIESRALTLLEAISLSTNARTLLLSDVDASCVCVVDVVAKCFSFLRFLFAVVAF